MSREGPDVDIVKSSKKEEVRLIPTTQKEKKMKSISLKNDVSS